MDDFQVYTKAPSANLVTAVNTTNNDLETICKWSTSHGLYINLTKTQVIVVGSSRTISKIDWTSLPQVFSDGSAIPYSDNVKNQGI